jgi:predicted MPP superfamily phosphohydrolase
VTAAPVLGALVLAALAAFAWGTFVERHWYALRRVTMPGALTRPGTLRVLHLSDVHLVPPQHRRVRFLRSLAALDHDLVVITGDLLGAEDAEDAALAAIAPLTGPGRPGVMVLGSNDLWAPAFKSPLHYLRPEASSWPRPRAATETAEPTARPLDTDRLIAGLADQGIVTLRGEARTLDTRAGRVAVAGFDDPHLEATVLPDPAALAVADDDVIARLGVVHAPYLAALDVLVDAGHDVLLAGHTHGGQVRVPGLGALTANCDLPLPQARGASRHRGRWLHVSAGLGHGRFAPFRFACRPEVTLLELTG